MGGVQERKISEAKRNPTRKNERVQATILMLRDGKKRFLSSSLDVALVFVLVLVFGSCFGLWLLLIYGSVLSSGD